MLSSLFKEPIKFPLWYIEKERKSVRERESERHKEKTQERIFLFFQNYSKMEVKKGKQNKSQKRLFHKISSSEHEDLFSNQLCFFVFHFYFSSFSSLSLNTIKKKLTSKPACGLIHFQLCLISYFFEKLLI